MARPKRQFTDEEIEQIEQYALENNKSETIARALDIAVNTLKRHFGRRMRQLRALGKLELKHSQWAIAKTNATMAQFLGMNELEQQNRQVTTIEQPPKAMSEQEQKAIKPALKLFKEGMS